MPIVIRLIAWLASSTFIVPLLKRLAVAVGLSVVTYTGVQAVMNTIDSHVSSGLGSLPSAAIQFLALTGLLKGLNVMLSGYAGYLGLKGLTAAGAISKAVWKPGTGSAVSGGSGS